MNWERKIKKTVPPMTQARALRLIKKHRPTSLAGARELGLRLVHLGSGVFRNVYRIKNTDLVIKFIVEYGDEYHARAEIRNYEKLKTSRALRACLPKLFYFDEKSGTSVWEFYPERINQEALRGRLCALVGKLASELTGANFTDVHTDNIRAISSVTSCYPRLKFIDLGC